MHRYKKASVRKATNLQMSPTAVGSFKGYLLFGLQCFFWQGSYSLSWILTTNSQVWLAQFILNIGFSHLAASSLSSMIFLLNSKLLDSNSTFSCGTSGQYGYDFLSLELWELETTLCKKPHIHNSYPLLYLKNDSPLVSPSFGLLVFLGPFPVLSNHLF